MRLVRSYAKRRLGLQPPGPEVHRGGAPPNDQPRANAPTVADGMQRLLAGGRVVRGGTAERELGGDNGSGNSVHTCVVPEGAGAIDGELQVTRSIERNQLHARVTRLADGWRYGQPASKCSSLRGLSA